MMISLTPHWMHAFFIDAMVSILVGAAIASRHLRQTLDHAQQRIATQAWNLQLLLPPEAGHATMLDDTYADPKCALQDFFEHKQMGRSAAFARALHGG